MVSFFASENELSIEEMEQIRQAMDENIQNFKNSENE
jgi:hypothetical protein